VLLDGRSYYILVGAKLKVQLGMEEADMDGGGQNVHTATGKVEPLQSGLTKQPVPIILNANTPEELTIWVFAQLDGAKTMLANCFLNVYTYKCSPFVQILTKLSADFCIRYL
jgi:hypothetical protein